MLTSYVNRIWKNVCIIITVCPTTRVRSIPTKFGLLLNEQIIRWPFTLNRIDIKLKRADSREHNL